MSFYPQQQSRKERGFRKQLSRQKRGSLGYVIDQATPDRELPMNPDDDDEKVLYRPASETNNAKLFKLKAKVDISFLHQDDFPFFFLHS